MDVAYPNVKVRLTLHSLARAQSNSFGLRNEQFIESPHAIRVGHAIFPVATTETNGCRNWYHREFGKVIWNKKFRIC